MNSDDSEYLENCNFNMRKIIVISKHLKAKRKRLNLKRKIINYEKLRVKGDI